VGPLRAPRFLTGSSRGAGGQQPHGMPAPYPPSVLLPSQGNRHDHSHPPVRH
jgi:hypothetical protein